MEGPSSHAEDEEIRTVWPASKGVASPGATVTDPRDADPRDAGDAADGTDSTDRDSGDHRDATDLNDA